MIVKDSSHYTRALRWLRSCQTQTPSIEEVIRLMKEVYNEGWEDARDLYHVTEVPGAQWYDVIDGLTVVNNGSSK